MLQYFFVCFRRSRYIARQLGAVKLFVEVEIKWKIFDNLLENVAFKDLLCYQDKSSNERWYLIFCIQSGNWILLIVKYLCPTLLHQRKMVQQLDTLLVWICVNWLLGSLACFIDIFPLKNLERPNGWWIWGYIYYNLTSIHSYSSRHNFEHMIFV